MNSYRSKPWSPRILVASSPMITMIKRHVERRCAGATCIPCRCLPSAGAIEFRLKSSTNHRRQSAFGGARQGSRDRDVMVGMLRLGDDGGARCASLANCSCDRASYPALASKYFLFALLETILLLLTHILISLPYPNHTNNTSSQTKPQHRNHVSELDQGDLHPQHRKFLP